MSQYRTIIFDVDGTAVDSPAKNLPDDSLREAIATKRVDYYFCAATARPWSFAKDVFHFLGLTAPCIISGGSQICDPRSGKALWQSNITARDLAAIMEVLGQYPEHGIVINDFTEEEYNSGGKSASKIHLPSDVFFLHQPHIPPTTANEILAKLRTIDGITYATGVSHTPGMLDIHITNSSATKEYAVTQLLTILGTAPENTYGIGDGYNDMHLFAAVGHKIAMGNAVPELKSLADKVIGPVNKQGLTAFIAQDL